MLVLRNNLSKEYKRHKARAASEIVLVQMLVWFLNQKPTQFLKQQMVHATVFICRIFCYLIVTKYSIK